MSADPLGDPQENSTLLVQSTCVFETKFILKANDKCHLNDQNKDTTSELSHDTTWHQAAMQHHAGFMLGKSCPSILKVTYNV